MKTNPETNLHKSTQFWLDIFFDLSDTSKYSENRLKIISRRIPILNREFIQVHLNFWYSEKKKEQQKIVTNPTQKVSDM